MAQLVKEGDVLHHLGTGDRLMIVLANDVGGLYYKLNVPEIDDKGSVLTGFIGNTTISNDTVNLGNVNEKITY